ncbi:MAG TPA: bifunctional enoyl-CoA hydratase/phosphate acetyltransferase [Hyphomicrobiales bacterium]|nr:bifunctional enoyl-CoA hydratase/phosphate acetyltransferase [Hyphomicrobiales bacterium]
MTDAAGPAPVAGPLAVGATLTVTAVVRERRSDGIAVLDCRGVDQTGQIVLTAIVDLRAPAVAVPPPALAPNRINEHLRHRQLVQRFAGQKPVRIAVVHPCDGCSVAGAAEAAAAGLIEPVLVGPEAKIRAAAKDAGIDISRFRLVATPHSHAAAAAAVAMARNGEVEALMKGSLHTDELMHEVVDPATGLCTGRRVSHVYLFDVPAYSRPLLITDAAINIQPTLEDKRDICQNAIDLARTIGIATPKVAILAAVETVSARMPSTIDAAALCKMADRGQITGGRLDGPLAFDNAISAEAARTKGIVSAVAGEADILLVPDLEVGNMLAKQLTFLAGADAAGIVVGARLPIVLTSRADSISTRVASCAIAALMVAARRAAVPAVPV